MPAFGAYEWTTSLSLLLDRYCEFITDRELITKILLEPLLAVKRNITEGVDPPFVSRAQYLRILEKVPMGWIRHGSLPTWEYFEKATVEEWLSAFLGSYFWEEPDWVIYYGKGSTLDLEFLDPSDVSDPIVVSSYIVKYNGYDTFVLLKPAESDYVYVLNSDEVTGGAPTKGHVLDLVAYPESEPQLVETFCLPQLFQQVAE